MAARRIAAPLLLGLVFAWTVIGRAQSPRFFPDDPISVEPETQDASGVADYELDLFIDLALNLFARPGDDADVRALNVNTIDEVPDSNWFTNRILARPLTPEQVGRGPLAGSGPAPGQWRVVGQKRSGFAPGFTARDSAGQLWFVSFDADGYPEAATGAILVANKLFWALGYWQVENFLVRFSRDQIVVDPKTVFRPYSGRTRPMRESDVDAVLRQSHRGADGQYRAVAARAVPGRVVGGFQYFGTRPDDPNDVVPHEHRRELRALKVFGAWTNLVDMKAGNTLDTVIEMGGRHVVRHYLQDVGSTFGTGANGPHDPDEGWEYLYDAELVRKRFFRLGFYFAPWVSAQYDEHPAVGRFEGDLFDPREWRPRVPTAAIRNSRGDDEFWAARRVAAFTDEMIGAAAATAEFSDPAAARLLTSVLIKRRDKIAQAYLPAINPLVDFALSDAGALTFRNAAVDAKVAEAPRAGYRAEWSSFDNATRETRVIATTSGPSTTIDGPPGMTGWQGFIRVLVTAVDPPVPQWKEPVVVHFQRQSTGWKLVGLERRP
jgi:hypothetical protein